MLDFRIQTFVAVCQHRSFTKAADALALTQPAVSQHIRALEERWGTTLIVYQGRTVTLTPAGEILYRFASSALVEAKLTEEKLLRQGAVRPFRIGATRTIGEYVLPPILGRYLQAHPEVELSMAVDNTEVLLGKLDEGSIDVAFVEGLFDPGAYESTVCLTDSLVAVCAPQNAPAAPVRLRDLFDRRLLVREAGSGSRQVLEAALASTNAAVRQFRSVLEIGNVEAMKTLAAMGQGVAFLYRRSLTRELAQGTLVEVPLGDFSVTHDYSYVHRKGALDTDTYQAFLTQLTQEAAAP